MTREKFYDAFCKMFGLSAALTDIEGLSVSADEAKAAREASDAIYETALEVPWLNWLIQPGNIWLQRAVCIGLFGYGKYRVVVATLQARQRAAGAPKPAGAPGPQAHPLAAFPAEAKAS